VRFAEDLDAGIAVLAASRGRRRIGSSRPWLRRSPRTRTRPNAADVNDFLPPGGRPDGSVEGAYAPGPNVTGRKHRQPGTHAAPFVI